jgi:hypothetical protein
MPADLPALAKLTEDVVAAMHTAEQREHRRHASRLRRGLPFLAVLIALLVPAATGHDAPAPTHGNAYDYATAAGACTAGAVIAVAATRATTSGCAAIRCLPAKACR